MKPLISLSEKFLKLFKLSEEAAEAGLLGFLLACLTASQLCRKIHLTVECVPCPIVSEPPSLCFAFFFEGLLDIYVRARHRRRQGTVANGTLNFKVEQIQI